MEVKITTWSLHQSRCRASGNKNFCDGYPKTLYRVFFYFLWYGNKLAASTDFGGWQNAKSNRTIKKRADADSCKAAGVMRRARLADFLHRLKASVLRGGTNVL